MQLDWHTIDRFLMGEAWVGSPIDAHLAMLVFLSDSRFNLEKSEIFDKTAPT
jgi:hypothetical protein